MRKLKESPIAVMLLVTFVAVMLVGAAWYWGPQHLTAEYTTITNKGSYGDTYGTVNALFAGLAFAILLGTIVGQMMELRYHRDELRSTREELQGQKEQLQAQSETLRLQRFEDTFFQLLRLHIDLVSSLSMPSSSGEVRGRPCLEGKMSLVRGELDREYERPLMSGESPNHGEALLRASKNALHSPSYLPHLGHYFGQLYHIFQFIDDSDIIDKQRYADFVQAQLDKSELFLLAYNGLSEAGRDFKPLIEKYGLLKSVTQLFRAEHADLYETGAFGPGGYPHLHTE